MIGPRKSENCFLLEDILAGNRFHRRMTDSFGAVVSYKIVADKFEMTLPSFT